MVHGVLKAMMMHNSFSAKLFKCSSVGLAEWVPFVHRNNFWLL